MDDTVARLRDANALLHTEATALQGACEDSISTQAASMPSALLV